MSADDGKAQAGIAVRSRRVDDAGPLVHLKPDGSFRLALLVDTAPELGLQRRP